MAFCSSAPLATSQELLPSKGDMGPPVFFSLILPFLLQHLSTVPFLPTHATDGPTLSFRTAKTFFPFSMSLSFISTRKGFYELAPPFLSAWFSLPQFTEALSSFSGGSPLFNRFGFWSHVCETSLSFFLETFHFSRFFPFIQSPRSRLPFTPTRRFEVRNRGILPMKQNLPSFLRF